MTGVAAPRARLTGQEELSYVRTRAQLLGLDPAAVVAVGYAEGGFPGAVGDQGTSFGPFQLHQGGGLPAGYGGGAADVWANSKAGLQYALERIAQYARGLTGTTAVHAIVTGFERPADGGAGDEARAANYLLNRNPPAGRMSPLRWVGVSTEGVQPGLLNRIANAVRAVGGVGVRVTSGRRPPGPRNDVQNSNHITGNAIDGYALFPDGREVPLGTALKDVASSYGLRSGDVAGFDPKTPGGYDPVHVDDGANVGGVTGSASPVRTRPGSSGGGGGDRGVMGFLEKVGGGIGSPFSLAFDTLFGGAGDVAGVLKAFLFIVQPKNWLRMVEFVVGVITMLFAFVGLAVLFLQRSPAVGKAANLATLAPGPLGVAGRAVTAVRRPQATARRVQAGRRSQAREAERRERDEMDEHFRANADELDERRRNRNTLRESREQDQRERIDRVRARAAGGPRSGLQARADAGELFPVEDG